jgi:hypothetical protein
MPAEGEQRARWMHSKETKGAKWNKTYPENQLSNGVLAVGRGDDAPSQHFSDRL